MLIHCLDISSSPAEEKDKQTGSEGTVSTKQDQCRHRTQIWKESRKVFWTTKLLCRDSRQKKQRKEWSMLRERPVQSTRGRCANAPGE